MSTICLYFVSKVRNFHLFASVVHVWKCCFSRGSFCRTGFVLSAMHFWDHFGSKGISLSFKTMCLCNNRLPQVSVLVGIFTHSLSECDPSTSLRFEHTRGRVYSAKTRHQICIKHSRHKSGKSSGTQRFLEVFLHPPFREAMACSLYTTSDNYAWACTKCAKDH